MFLSDMNNKIKGTLIELTTIEGYTFLFKARFFNLTKQCLKKTHKVSFLYIGAHQILKIHMRHLGLFSNTAPFK